MLRRFSRRPSARTIALAAAILAAPIVSGEWKNTSVAVPVERLLENLEARIKENPADAGAYYVRGRIHSLVFATGADTLAVTYGAKDPATGRDPLPGFPPWETILVKLRESVEKALQARRKHLIQSVEDYGKSVRLDPGQPYTWLGLGWVLEQGVPIGLELGPVPGHAVAPEAPSDEERATFAALVERLGAEGFEEREMATQELVKAGHRAVPVLLGKKDHEDPEVRQRIRRIVSQSWTAAALEAYRKAFALSEEGDRGQGGFGPSEDFSVALEAGQGILRLLGEGEDGAAERARVREAVEEIQAKPRVITPLVVPLEDGGDAEALLAPRTSVSFDLDGDGVKRSWPWVGSEVAFVVWDPLRTGRIESGLQLFGSVTWWMAWRNGYEPLDALDDDRDGWLAGPELEGIALWRDGNENGVSEPGEVFSLEAAGIEALAVRPDGVRDKAPWCARGVRLKDGRTRPSYDWTPTEKR